MQDIKLDALECPQLSAYTYHKTKPIESSLKKQSMCNLISTHQKFAMINKTQDTEIHNHKFDNIVTIHNTFFVKN